MRRFLVLLALLTLLPDAARAQAQRGGRLLYNVVDSRTVAVHLFDLKTGRDSVLAAAAGGCDPAFSPDGRQIVFARPAGDKRAQIWVMAVDGQSMRPLCTMPGYLYGPRFTPDMRRVIFCATEAGSLPHAYSVSARGGVATRLDGRPISAVAVSPDGRLLACAVVAEKPFIAIRPLQGGAETRIPLAGMGWSLAWAPTARTARTGRLAVVSLDGTTSRLWSVDVEGTHCAALSPESDNCVGAAFSDDGRTIYTSSTSPLQSALRAVSKQPSGRAATTILRTTHGARTWMAVDGGYGFLMLRAVSTMHTD